jgi:5S rRNA maturation endonuclease (ribonuclease M5)
MLKNQIVVEGPEEWGEYNDEFAKNVQAKLGVELTAMIKLDSQVIYATKDDRGILVVTDLDNDGEIVWIPQNDAVVFGRLIANTDLAIDE